MPKLLVMAGGTGGHIYPGIAVAEALRARGWQIAWLGNPSGMESRIVPQLGYSMCWLQFTGLRGKGVLRAVMLPFNLLRGFWQALGIMRRERPDVVLGMGGYVSFPGAMMASLMGRALVLHEQNSVAGLANKTLASLADRVLSGFPNVLPKAQWLGNPVRADLTQLPTPAQRFAERSGPLKVLVVGGSLGAQALNDVVPKALALLPAENRPQVVHQSGEKQLPALQAAYAAAGVEGDLLPFIDNMAQRYADADVVICRAGALTVAELAVVGVASVLVPYPHAVDDHQTGNAKFLAEQSAALLMPQPELNATALADWLGAVSRAELLNMAEAAQRLARPSAAEDVADICAALLGDKRGGKK